MQLIKNLKEKYNATRRTAALEEAENIINLSDFDNNLYITFRGIPLIKIGDNETPKEIIDRLYVLRQNYIRAMTPKINTGDH